MLLYILLAGYWKDPTRAAPDSRNRLDFIIFLSFLLWPVESARVLAF